MMAQIPRTERSKAIKSYREAGFNPLCESNGRIKAKKGKIEAVRSVGMTKGVGEAATQLISSTSTQETPIARALIEKETQEIVSAARRPIRKK